jgi:hypothetical protein
MQTITNIQKKLAAIQHPDTSFLMELRIMVLEVINHLMVNYIMKNHPLEDELFAEVNDLQVTYAEIQQISKSPATDAKRFMRVKADLEKNLDSIQELLSR